MQLRTNLKRLPRGGLHAKSPRIVSISVVGGVPPAYSESEIGDVTSTIVEVTFDRDIFSPLSDYKAGFTIKVDAVGEPIATGTRQTNHAIVHYEMAPAVITPASVITVEYDDASGDIEAESDGTPMLDISAQSTVNYVGSHFYFDEIWDSVWMVMD